MTYQKYYKYIIFLSEVVLFTVFFLSPGWLSCESMVQHSQLAINYNTTWPKSRKTRKNWFFICLFGSSSISKCIFMEEDQQIHATVSSPKNLSSVYYPKKPSNCAVFPAVQSTVTQVVQFTSVNNWICTPCLFCVCVPIMPSHWSPWEDGKHPLNSEGTAKIERESHRLD